VDFVAFPEPLDYLLTIVVEETLGPDLQIFRLRQRRASIFDREHARVFTKRGPERRTLLMPTKTARHYHQISNLWLHPLQPMT
jgi:hypothetical protein